ncbi:MAG: metalloregulator ArsR/SmtB family transcription factor [Phycisphaerales bacterium]|nr:metalloregulator ArsR/SmtB family transcription factor [Phycisphaerales bacterium]
MKRLTAIQPITDRLGALAEPIRLRLLRLLENEELSVGEVAKVVQLPQSTVSRHLKLLADGGWVRKRAVGTASFYRVVHDDLPVEARQLWVTVRSQLGQTPELAEDDRRLAGVLAERRDDSLSFFGRLAGEWDELRSNLFGTAFTADALLSLLPPEWTVADLGCGTGNGSERIAPYVEKVIAVDQSEPMLAAAQKRCEGLGNVECRPGRLEALPIEDASVDAAIILLVLHHLDDPVKVLAETRRVLRTDRGGGVALVVDMTEHDRTEFRETLGHRHLGFGEEAMTGFMERAGLTRTRYRELPSDPEGKGPGLFVATARAPVAMKPTESTTHE